MSKVSKNNKILLCSIVLFIIIFISNPTTYMQSCLRGVNVWFFNVVPALFPFFFATRLLILLDIGDIPLIDKITKKIFCVEGGSSIYLLSLLSGYPVGAKLICDAKKSGKIDEISAKKMLAFCSVSGPMFIIGTVGIALFNSIKVGYILLSAHLLSSFINGLVFRKMYGKPKPINAISQTKKENILSSSMLDSINSILMVGGYIVFAYILIDLLNNLNIIPSLANILSFLNIAKNHNELIVPFLNGLIEMTRGIADITNYCSNLKVAIPIISFLLGFGGLSVFLQSTSFVHELNIKKHTYFMQKILQGIWATVISIILVVIFI